jgi:hypothetical protein
MNAARGVAVYGNMNEQDVVIRGTMRVIAYARDAAGQAHAQAFLALEVPPKDAARLSHWFRVVAEHGERSANREAFRHEAGEIWAFKSFQTRVATYRSGHTWFLLCGFLKKSDKWPKQELERAERIRREHIARGGK